MSDAGARLTEDAARVLADTAPGHATGATAAVATAGAGRHPDTVPR